MTELFHASMHAASLSDVKRSEVNQLQFDMHIEYFLVIFLSNEKKQETLQTRGAFPDDNFNFSKTQFLI